MEARGEAGPRVFMDRTGAGTAAEAPGLEGLIFRQAIRVKSVKVLLKKRAGAGRHLTWDLFILDARVPCCEHSSITTFD